MGAGAERQRGMVQARPDQQSDSQQTVYRPIKPATRALPRASQVLEQRAQGAIASCAARTTDGGSLQEAFTCAWVASRKDTGIPLCFVWREAACRDSATAAVLIGPRRRLKSDASPPVRRRQVKRKMLSSLSAPKCVFQNLPQASQAICAYSELGHCLARCRHKAVRAGLRLKRSQAVHACCCTYSRQRVGFVQR